MPCIAALVLTADVGDLRVRLPGLDLQGRHQSILGVDHHVSRPVLLVIRC